MIRAANNCNLIYWLSLSGVVNSVVLNVWKVILDTRSRIRGVI